MGRIEGFHYKKDERMYRKRIYFNLLKAQVHLLYGCTFFLIGLVVFLWWLQLYRPLITANESLEKEMYVCFSRLKSQKTSQKMAQDTLKKFSELKASMIGSPYKKDAALCSLVSLAQRNNLNVISARLGRSKNKSWCSLQEMHVECRGTYDQLISFFDNLINHKPIMNCKKCDITRNDKDIFTVRATFNAYAIV